MQMPVRDGDNVSRFRYVMPGYIISKGRVKQFLTCSTSYCSAAFITHRSISD